MSQMTAVVRERAGSTTRLSKQMTAEIVDRCLKEGKQMPLQIFLEIMNSEPDPQQLNETPFDYKQRLETHTKLKLEAAKAAAPYVHPRIVSLDPGDSLAEEASANKQLILVPVPTKNDAA